MKVNQQELIDELYTTTDKAIDSIKMFKKLPLEQLNFKHSQDSWSILECIEHLNLYGKFYLPEIEKAILLAQRVALNNNYKSSFLGDFFVNSIKADNKKRMKAPLMMTPQRSELSCTSLDMFIKAIRKTEYNTQIMRGQRFNKSKNTNISN
jgi:hypothetical protein